ncbi:ABC transporter permease subunit [Streptomyces sp. NPDC030392]|uniref:ABC transporter permease subunit n=1 Tax=Streptomyces sp. NPDC030392 TaxID=3155468 RepID=UPI0033DC7F25
MTWWPSCWYAELRKAVLSPVVLVTVVGAVLAAAGTGLYGYRNAYRHFEDGAPATYLDEPAGALWAAAQHSGTFVGLVVAAALAAALYAVECESGMWPSLLASRPGRARLIALKASVVLLLTATFTIVLAAILFAVGRTAAEVTGFATSGGPGWEAAAQAVARSLVVQALFVAVAFAAASLTRRTLGTMAGALGPVVVLAPVVGVEGITPLHPQTWVAAWLRLPDEAQYSLYLWTREPSPGTGAPGVEALAALAAVHIGVLALAARGDRLLRPTD